MRERATPRVRLERPYRTEARALGKLDTFAKLYPQVEAMALKFYNSNTELANSNVSKLADRLAQAGNDPSRARLLIKDALEKREYNESEITPSIHCDLLEIASQKERIGRAILREVLLHRNNLGLSPFEKTLILGGLEVQNANDALYLKVRRALLADETNMEGWFRNNPDLQDGDPVKPKPVPQKVQQRIINSQSDPRVRAQMTTEFADAFNFTDVVFTENRENPVRGIRPQPFSIAFPTETENLVQALKKLKRGITLDPRIIFTRRHNHEKQQVHAYQTYFSALIKAVSSTTTDIPQRNKNWAAVDTAWMDTWGRVQFIHMMESYHDISLGRRQEPEFNILIQDKTEESQLKTEQLKALKQRQLEILRSIFPQGGLPIDPIDPIGVLDKAEAQLFTAVIPSGPSLAFRFAGDNVPNNPLVKEAKGTKIIENQPTFEERAQKQIVLLRKVFGDRLLSPVYQGYFPTENLKRYNKTITDIMELLFTPGHEYAHNIFFTKTHLDLLTHHLQDKLEEHKADLGITVIIQEYFRDNINMQKQFIATHFADALRSLTHHDSHRNGAVMSIYNMMEAEIVTVVDGNFIFDPEGQTMHGENKIEKFFGLELEQLYNIRDAYLYDLYHPLDNPEDRIEQEMQKSAARALAQTQVDSYKTVEKDPRMQQLINTLRG